ncbi:MAG: glycine cleavage system protein GcvH [Burkholderiaceae bacterium]
MTFLYTPEHQWLQLGADGIATVGITPHAQDTLGDIVFVELPAVGRLLAQSEVAAVVESVKTAADVYAPVAGMVVEVNEGLRSEPSLANSAPQQGGWFFKVKLSEPESLGSLLSETAYQALLGDA